MYLSYFFIRFCRRDREYTPDGYFDFVYAGSVFTHIGELADAWFLEVRRLLKPGGRAYLTIFDDASLEQIRESSEKMKTRATEEIDTFHASTGVLDKDYDTIVMGESIQRTRVIFGTEALRERLARWFEVKAIKPKAYGWQSALILERRD